MDLHSGKRAGGREAPRYFALPAFTRRRTEAAEVGRVCSRLAPSMRDKNKLASGGPSFNAFSFSREVIVSNTSYVFGLHASRVFPVLEPSPR